MHRCVVLFCLLFAGIPTFAAEDEILALKESEKIAVFKLIDSGVYKTLGPVALDQNLDMANTMIHVFEALTDFSYNAGFTSLSNCYSRIAEDYRTQTRRDAHCRDKAFRDYSDMIEEVINGDQERMIQLYDYSNRWLRNQLFSS